jgi:hypothetical protein
VEFCAVSIKDNLFPAGSVWLTTQKNVVCMSCRRVIATGPDSGEPVRVEGDEISCHPTCTNDTQYPSPEPQLTPKKATSSGHEKTKDELEWESVLEAASNVPPVDPIGLQEKRALMKKERQEKEVLRKLAKAEKKKKKNTTNMKTETKHKVKKECKIKKECKKECAKKPASATAEPAAEPMSDDLDKKRKMLKEFRFYDPETSAEIRYEPRKRKSGTPHHMVQARFGKKTKAFPLFGGAYSEFEYLQKPSDERFKELAKIKFADARAWLDEQQASDK